MAGQKFSARDRLKIMGALLAGSVIGGCSGGGGGGGSSTPTPTPPAPPPPPPPPPPVVVNPLKEVYAGKFKSGAAVHTGTIVDVIDRDLLETHFDSIVAEYQMKADIIAPVNVFSLDFSAADDLVDFATARTMDVRGHALVWHSTTPDHFLQGSAAQIRDSLETYIQAVVSRYAGRIQAWDVVNEVIADGGTSPYRASNWFNAVGKDYIDWAFQAARAADPDCKLFINDYSTEFSGKRGRLIEVVRDLLDRGIPVDGVGHQFHTNVSQSADIMLEAIDEIDSLNAGLEQHVTELDISVYSDPGSCFSNGTGCEPEYGTNLSDVPTDIIQMQALLARNLYNGLMDRDSVTNVTWWGVRDNNSWLNNFPVQGRSNFPLLFDADGEPKPCFFAVTDPDYEI